MQEDFFKGGLLASYLKKPEVLRCPSDVVDGNFYKRGQYLTSYVWNGGVVRYVTPSSQGPSVKFSSGVIKPTRILQWENDETLLNFIGQWNDFAGPPDEGLSRRHSDGAVIGRVDGSSGRMAMDEFYKLAGTYPTGVPPNGPWSGRGNIAMGNNARPPNDLWWY